MIAVERVVQPLREVRLQARAVEPAPVERGAKVGNFHLRRVERRGAVVARVGVIARVGEFFESVHVVVVVEVARRRGLAVRGVARRRRRNDGPVDVDEAAAVAAEPRVREEVRGVEPRLGREERAGGRVRAVELGVAVVVAVRQVERAAQPQRECNELGRVEACRATVTRECLWSRGEVRYGTRHHSIPPRCECTRTTVASQWLSRPIIVRRVTTRSHLGVDAHAKDVASLSLSRPILVQRHIIA